MNLLHITPYYAPAYAFGGVARAVEGLARALAARGHAVTVITTDAHSQTERSPAPLDEIRGGVRVIRIPNRSLTLRGRLNLSTPTAFGRAAAQWADWADAVHLHEFRTVENWLALRAIPPSTPVILSPHGTLSTDAGRGRAKRLWDALFSAQIARRISAVVGLTESERAEAESFWKARGWGGAARFIVIPNGVSWAEFEAFAPGDPLKAAYWMKAQFCARFDVPPDAPLALYLGRLHPRKGIDALARAFALADVPGARLALVGPDDGALRHVRPLLDERAIVTGYLEGALRGGALAAASVFALPALGGEGLPMAALEALAAGVPVLLSPACHLPEVEAAGAGRIVPPDPEALAQALRAYLMLDPAERARIGAAGRALVESRFTWERAAEAYEEVYGEASPRAGVKRV
jgi:poly(glycerol-phosphate) alpha-glucosyltransferase